MQILTKLLLASLLFQFTAGAGWAEQPIPPETTIGSGLFGDVRFVAAIVAAGVTILVNLFAKPLIDRWLESWKSELSIRKAETEARINYELEAKKRLYTAVGPLRFQLLLAARDAAHQVKSQASGKRDFPVAVKNYYGISTLYKIIRPLALLELIEEQITYADFSVDKDAIDLLRFKRASYAAFSSGPTVQGHPNANWNDEEKHIFYNTISRIAHTIIVSSENGGKRVMRFHESEDFLSERSSAKKIDPLPSIYEGFSFKNKPLFGARLVLFGYICSKFVNDYGTANAGTRRWGHLILLQEYLLNKPRGVLSLRWAY